MCSLAWEVGIDVSKDELVVSIGGAKPFAVSNTQEGVEELARRLPPGCRVHLECSGGYERTAQRGLGEAGFRVCRHNALKARRLAQALGKTAKTDPIDARALSLSAGLLDAPVGRSEERQSLADLSRAIDTLKETVAGYKKRRGMPEMDGDAKGAYDAAIQMLSKLAKDLEETFVQRVESSSLAASYHLLLSVPHIGPVAARGCLCEMPENLRSQSPSQICSYAGLAPVDDSSGKRCGPSRLGRGNSRLKKVFYMPAVSSILLQTWAKELYTRLKDKGRTFQQAIVAVMRRILLRVVAVLKRGSPWQHLPTKT